MKEPRIIGSRDVTFVWLRKKHHKEYRESLSFYVVCAVEPGYNDICLYDTPPITSDIFWYQLIRPCLPQHYITLLEQDSFIATLKF